MISGAAAYQGLRKAPEALRCGFDPALKVQVHRFEMGADTCACGAEKVAGPKFRGWRQGNPSKK
jgi:hypothetical protein